VPIPGFRIGENSQDPGIQDVRNVIPGINSLQHSYSSTIQNMSSRQTSLDHVNSEISDRKFSHFCFVFFLLCSPWKSKVSFADSSMALSAAELLTLWRFLLPVFLAVSVVTLLTVSVCELSATELSTSWHFLFWAFFFVVSGSLQTTTRQTYMLDTYILM